MSNTTSGDQPHDQYFGTWTLTAPTGEQQQYAAATAADLARIRRAREELSWVGAMARYENNWADHDDST